MVDDGIRAQPRFASVMQAPFFASIAQRDSQLRYEFRIFRKSPLMVTPQDANEPGQPIGFAVPGWKPPQPPARAAMEGRVCRLEPLDAEDARVFRTADRQYCRFSSIRQRGDTNKGTAMLSELLCPHPPRTERQ